MDVSVRRCIEAILDLTSGEEGMQPTTYTKLSIELFGKQDPRNRQMNIALDAIQKLCRDTGYPCLSVMVGRSNDVNHMPGDGFFESYCNHFPEDAKDYLTRDALVLDVRKKVRAVKDWSPLLDASERCN